MNRITNKKEIIQSSGCTFHVYRKRKTPNIFTLTLWRKSLGYVFNLSTSLLWWANSFPILFPDWNVRIYFDNSVFSGLHGDRTDWIDLFAQLLKYKNIELWFYQCPWAFDTKRIGSHKNTFGSLIRFHAFDDPDTEVIVSHNLEYLTSPKDRERTQEWLKSGKKYHLYTAHNLGLEMYSCVGNYYMCHKNGLYRNPSLMATFGLRKNKGESTNIFSEGMLLINQKTRLLYNFDYGVDEIILTLLLKPKITTENTFVSVILLEYKNLDSDLLNKLYKTFGRPFCKENGIPVYSDFQFIEFLTVDIDIAVKFVAYTKEKIVPHIKSLILKNITKMKQELDPYLPHIEKAEKSLEMDFKKYIKDVIEPKISKNILMCITGKSKFNLYTGVYQEIFQTIGISDNNLDAYIYLYEILLDNLLYCIDFPGSCIKNKEYIVEEKEGEEVEQDTYRPERKSFSSIFLSKHK